MVPKAGLEPARPLGHYPLKVACLPISPLRQFINVSLFLSTVILSKLKTRYAGRSSAKALTALVQCTSSTNFTTSANEANFILVRQEDRRLFQ